jgi:hypothetical protein
VEGIVGAFNGMLYLLLGIGAVIVLGVGGYLVAMQKGRMQGE